MTNMYTNTAKGGTSIHHTNCRYKQCSYKHASARPKLHNADTRSTEFNMQGSPCPASGFCGVPECGEWSAGPDNRGSPCNAAAYTPAPTLNISLAVSPDDAPPKSLGEWFFGTDSPQSGAPLGPDVGIAIPSGAIGAEAPASIGLPLGPPAIGTPTAGRTAAESGSPGEEQEEESAAADAAAEDGGAVHVRAAWAPLPWGLVTAAAAAAVMLR